MNYKLLGRSGLRVSEICLGTMTFGNDWGWGASPEESARILDAYLDRGGNFIDSANLYTFGEAERILGQIIGAGRRNRVVLATKYSDAPPGADPNAAGNHRKSMMQAIDGSLQRLGTDRIDIYYIHTWDFTTRPDEVMRGLDDLTRQGKILYAGISDAPAWVISRCNELADHRGWSPFVVTQIEYSLLERTSERELIPMARALDVGLVGWSPLAGGLLTGKYTRSDRGAGAKRLDVAPYKPLTERNRHIAATLDDVADELGCSSGQAALAWAASKGIIPIVGATTVAQIESNLAFTEIRLSPEQHEALEAASSIELGFPHDFYQQAKGFIYGGMADRIDRHRDEGVGLSAAPSGNPLASKADFSYTDVVVQPASKEHPR